MVKAVKSMFNFDNASWIFVGAVVIILIILAVFYFRRSKNVESFRAEWRDELKVGANSQDECGSLLDYYYYNSDKTCRPRCKNSSDECPLVPNAKTNKLENLICSHTSPEAENMLGICLNWPGGASKPIITKNCGDDFGCAAGYRCDKYASSPDAKTWTGQCVEDDRPECTSDQDCGDRNKSQCATPSVFKDLNVGRCLTQCENDEQCGEYDSCKQVNTAKKLKGFCYNKTSPLKPTSDKKNAKCGDGKGEGVCFDGYKCQNGTCIIDRSQGGSGEGDEGSDSGGDEGSGSGGNEGSDAGSGDEGFSNYYEYYAK